MEDLGEFKKRCGEIYLLSTGNMTFHCTLCENKFDGFDHFAEHVNEAHQFNDYTVDSIKEEILDEIECAGEECILPMPMDNESGDENTNDMPETEIILSETEVQTAEDENVDAPVKVANTATTSLDVKKKGKPKKIVPRRPRNKDLNLKCEECDYSTNLKVKLVEHMRRHFGDRPFSCDYCNQRFYMQNEKTRHTARQHPETVEPKKPSPERIELRALIKSLLIDLGNNKFECKECNFTSEGRQAMWLHVRRHSTYKPYECNICPKKFFTSNERNTHIRSHTGEKPYLCTECGNAFSTSSKLTVHLKRHNNIRDRGCPICERRFFNTRQLQSHMAVHSDERPFACKLCSSTFKRQKTLACHMKVHLNKREYQCEICDAGFKTNASLVNHIKNKHTFTNEEYNKNSDENMY